MNRIIDNEFNIPTDEKYPEELNCYAEKPTDASKEFSASIEVNIPDDEFNTNTHRAGKKRNQTDQSR